MFKGHIIPESVLASVDYMDSMDFSVLEYGQGFWAYSPYNKIVVEFTEELDFLDVSEIKSWNPEYEFVGFVDADDDVVTELPVELTEKLELFAVWAEVPVIIEIEAPEDFVLGYKEDELVLEYTGTSSKGLYALEIDHSLEGVLPEFKVYASSDNVWGSPEAAGMADDAGVTATFTDGTWVIKIGGQALEIIRNYPQIKFYSLVIDVDENQSGSMYDGTYETTVVTIEEEPAPTPIAEAAALAKDAEVIIVGVVTGFTFYNTQYNSYDKVWLEDETGAITVYGGKFPQDLAVGDKYKVDGKIDNYAGLVQIALNAELTLIDKGNTLIDPLEIADLSDLDVDAMAKRINVENAVVISVSPNGREMTIELDGIQTTLRSAANTGDVNDHLLTAIVGQRVNLTGIHVDWFNGPQLNPTLVEQVEFIPLTNQEKMVFAETELDALYKDKVFNMDAEIELLDESALGVAINWALDPADAIANGKWKVVENDTPVELTATLSIADLEETVVLNVTIKFVDSSVVQDSFEEDFAGFDLGSTYTDGGFAGKGETNWVIGHSRNVGDYGIDDEGIMLRRGSDSHITITFANGLSALSFEFRKAFSGGDYRELEIYINDVLVLSPKLIDVAGDHQTKTFLVELEDLTYEGEVIVKIKPKVSGNHQTTVDNFAWTENK